MQTAVCEVCDWSYLYDANGGSIICPHCYRATLTPLAPGELAPDSRPESGPELAAPFRITETDVEKQIKKFARSYWFTPGDLSARNILSRLRRVYIPAWLVDSDVAAAWQAEVGFDYQIVSHQENYSNKSWITTKVKETKVRWEPRVGQLQRHYDNVRAPAMEEIDDIRNKLGKFESTSAETYRPEMLDGATVRLPNRDQVDAWPDTHLRFRRLAENECRQASKADHIRQFGWRAQYANQRWSLLLLPVYSTFYLDDGGQPVPVLLNGRTGQLHGLKRASMKRAKIYSLALATLAAFLFIATVALFFFVPFLGVLVGLLTMILGMSAILPIAYASQFNRRQKSDLIFARVEA
jgi:hypothetical protein